MVAREGKKPVLKVLDFGLAKATSEGQADSGLTREGQMLGTPDFIAPEQIRDAQSADIRADVYSLGCTLYCLLAGRPPFAGDNLWDLYQAHFSMDANPLNLVRTEVPVELAALVAKMMAKEPARRFQTPGEVAQALSPFFKPATAQPRGSGDFREPRVDPNRIPQIDAASLPPASVMVPAAKGDAAPKTRAEAVAWGSLIQIKQDELLTEAEQSTLPKSAPQPATGPNRRPRLASLPVALAAAAVGLIALGVIVINVWSGNGETKATAPDDARSNVEADGPTVERSPQPEQLPERVDLENDHRADGSKPKEVPGAGDSSGMRIGQDAMKRHAPVSLMDGGRAAESTGGPPERPAGESLNREITDRRLIIKAYNRTIMDNAQKNFPVQVDRNIKATLTSGKIYINEVFGRENVLCTHPYSPSSPATMDFSAMTKDRAGSLILEVHGYPTQPGGRIVLRSDGRVINDLNVEFGDGWKRIAVPFRWNGIVVEHHAVGWMMEFLFVDYRIVIDSSTEQKKNVARDEPGRQGMPERVDENVAKGRVALQTNSASTSEKAGQNSALKFKELAVLKVPGGSINWIAFSEDGARMTAVALLPPPEANRRAYGSTGQVVVWDIPEHRQLWAWKNPYVARAQTPMHRVWVTPDGRTIVTSDSLRRYDNSPVAMTIKVWDGTTGAVKGALLKGATAGLVASMSHDGKSFAVSSPVENGLPTRGPRVTWSGGITVWDIASLERSSIIRGTRTVYDPQKTPSTPEPQQGGGVEALAFSPDGSRIAAAYPFALKVWSLEPATEITSLKGMEGIDLRPFHNPPGQLQWLVDGKTLVRRSLSSAEAWEKRRSGLPFGRPNVADSATLLEMWDTNKEQRWDAFLLAEPRQERERQPGELPLPPGAGWEAGPAGNHVRQSLLSADGRRLFVHVVRLNMNLKPPMKENQVVVWDVPARRRLGTLPLPAETLPPKFFQDMARREASIEQVRNVRRLTPEQARIAERGIASLGPNDLYLAPLDFSSTVSDQLEADPKDMEKDMRIALSPNGKLLAVGDREGVVRVYDVADLGNPPASRGSTPQPGEKGAAADEPPRGDFIPLFNGRDLTGWKNVLPDNGSKWSVTADGILQGRGGSEAGKGAMLLTERRDFTDFVLRVTYRFPQVAGGRFVIRQNGPDDSMKGYQIHPFGSGNLPIGRIGRLVDPPPDMGPEITPVPFADDQWKTIEIAANKNEVTTSMDGMGVLDSKVDSDGMYQSGGIALRCRWDSRIQIREIAIKELSGNSVPKTSSARRAGKS